MDKNSNENQHIAVVTDDENIFSEDFNNTIKEILENHKNIKYLTLHVDTSFNAVNKKKDNFYCYMINISVDISEIKKTNKKEDFLDIVFSKIIEFYKEYILVH